MKRITVLGCPTAAATMAVVRMYEDILYCHYSYHHHKLMIIIVDQE
ncbi:MAG TPA: hypothetical protein VE076_00845 [Nitrososphaeraceae archaeon]|nr:hypothetical protein [Nitrososphaeraceae archaeon]